MKDICVLFQIRVLLTQIRHNMGIGIVSIKNMCVVQSFLLLIAIHPGFEARLVIGRYVVHLTTSNSLLVPLSSHKCRISIKIIDKNNN